MKQVILILVFLLFASCSSYKPWRASPVIGHKQIEMPSDYKKYGFPKGTRVYKPDDWIKGFKNLLAVRLSGNYAIRTGMILKKDSLIYINKLGKFHSIYLNEAHVFDDKLYPEDEVFCLTKSRELYKPTMSHDCPR